ncbi:MAG: hypothetical protein HFJ65_03115 [Eggerthellaceae bacterium]|nr:hypothetical protein [Eggerthellaceae bacterium]
MSKKDKKGRRAERIQELEIRKRAGMIQAIAAFVVMVVLILIKTTATTAGAEWANTMVANAFVFICALVAAGVAGYGTRKWNLARKELDQLR